MSKVFDRISKRCSLKSRLFASNQIAFIDLLTELGFRKDKPWTVEEDEMLDKLSKAAIKHTEIQLSQIKKWEKDGRPE